MRLLFCTRCRTIEEIVDYDGPPELDSLLSELVRRHNVKDPMAHGGQETLPLSLMRVSDYDWANNRAEIIKGITDKHSQSVGFEGYVLEALDTFKYDAMTCYVRHRRPQDGCVDWHDESKRIGRPTLEGRAAVADQEKLRAKDPYLCDFCVCKSLVTTKQNAERGLYKD